jgi:hypothetical protein
LDRLAGLLRSYLASRRRRRQAAAAARRRLVFCTIATRDFLPWALVLFDSLRRHHPEARLLLLHVSRDGEEPRVPVIDDVEVITVRDLVDTEQERLLRRRYSVPEMCFALKPPLLAYALDHFGDRAVYLDSDIDVHGPFAEAAIALETSHAALTPHLDTPIALDGMRPSDLVILRAGAFNLGFIAVAESPETRRLLDWWGSRTARWGFVAPESGYQGDQKWMDFAPSLFPGAAVLRDIGYNVAYWNLHSRFVDRTPDGALVVNGQPLVFIHFSGLDPAKPGVLSKFQNRPHADHQPALMELARDFASRIQAAEARAASLRWRADERAPVDAADPVTPCEGPMDAEAYRATIRAGLPHGSPETGEEALMEVEVTNASPHAWPVGALPDGSGGIAITYHLRDRSRAVVAWDMPRFFLPRDLGPGESVRMEVAVKAPAAPGFYFIEFDLVHENVAWFADRGNPTAWSEMHVGGIFDVAEG